MLLLKKIHKWLSLLVGLQLLIWIGSGLFFNLMDHDKSQLVPATFAAAIAACLWTFTVYFFA